VLGATIAVNNPAVPGLATQASVAPSLPAGRTVAGVKWRSTRADCTFSAPAQLQTDVTCNASSAAAATVTATLVDSTGATKTVTSPLTFAAGTARPVTLALGAAGQTPPSGGSAPVCTGAPFALVATVLDTASGQPVKGLTATFTKKSETMTTAAAAGSATTTAAGTATTSQTVTTATTYKAQTAAGTTYAAGGPASLTAVPARCATSLTADADRSDVYYSDPVTVSGRLAATSSGTPVAPAGVTLSVRLTTGAGKVLALGTVKTGTEGSYSLVVKPTASGTISVALAGSTSYAAATATAGEIAVALPETALTAGVAPSEVGYGDGVLVTGTLQRVAGGATTPLAGRTVGIFVAPSGGGTTVKVGSATTNATGGFTALVPLRVSGALSVAFTAIPGQPAASADAGPVRAGTWTTAVTASTSAASVAPGGAVTISGGVTKAYGAAPVPAAGLKVSIYFKADGASTRTLVASSTTTTTGTFSQRVVPKATGAFTAVVGAVSGYTGSSAPPVSVHVG
jgi:5-hydroxyisourate hydrolase-like protein (transthyretin family)